MGNNELDGVYAHPPGRTGRRYLAALLNAREETQTDEVVYNRAAFDCAGGQKVTN